MNQDMEIILKQVYPMVDKAFSDNNGIRVYNRMIGNFVDKRHEELYANAPYHRILYSQSDIDELFKLIGVKEKDVNEILKETYYGKIARFSPVAVKDPATIISLCMVRFFLLNKKKFTSEFKTSLMYISFSGKFYPSLHYGSYPVVQPIEYKHVMDYVVNNVLSDKYSIRQEKTVVGAVTSVATTWVDTYDDMFNEFDDESVVYIVDQLHNRIKSFMVNIAEEYYRVYDNKENYMTYDSDSMDEDSYRIIDNNSLKIDRVVEGVTNAINTKAVDPTLIRAASGTKVKPDELRSIVEEIISNPVNSPDIKEVVNITVSEFVINNPDKKVYDSTFVSQSIKMVPNTKNPNIIRRKEIVEKWLDDNSPNYRIRSKNTGTKIAYNKAVYNYFVLVMNKEARNIR